MDYRATLLLYLELLFALAIVWREGLLKTSGARAAALILIPATFVLRYLCLTYQTLDYQDWIRVWLDSLRKLGPWKGLGQEIWSCNYNPPYLYFLSLITLSPVHELLLVKLLSIFFDVVLAGTVMRLVGLFSDSPVRRLVAFIGVLWHPSVFLNGALWGQCDVIYAAFAVLSVYLALSDRPGWSVVSIAVSISFKLQGIFLLPVFFIFLVAGKIRIRHIFLFPAAYIVTILPAVLAGRNFWQLLTLYYNNTSSIGDGLNYNSSSLYALFNFSTIPNEIASSIGIILAFFFCSSLYVWLFIRRGDLNNRVLLTASVLFCIGVPFFLPHMHDRYFFMADILTFAFAVVVPYMALTPLLVAFGSFLGYHAYLKTRFLLPMRYGAVAMLLALLSAAVYLAFSLDSSKKVLTNDVNLV